MITEVCCDGRWIRSFGLSQFHGHGSWLVCGVAGSYRGADWSRVIPPYTCENIPCPNSHQSPFVHLLLDSQAYVATKCMYTHHPNLLLAVLIL